MKPSQKNQKEINMSLEPIITINESNKYTHLKGQSEKKILNSIHEEINKHPDRLDTSNYREIIDPIINEICLELNIKIEYQLDMQNRNINFSIVSPIREVTITGE